MDWRAGLKVTRPLRSGDVSLEWVPDQEYGARQRVVTLLRWLGVRPPEGVQAWTAKL